MRRSPCHWLRLASVVAVVILSTGACAARRRVAGGVNLSSERSDYSPVVRLAVVLPPRDGPSDADGVRVVRVDSGAVVAPGQFVSRAPAIMRDLRIAALVVQFRPAVQRVPGAEPSWIELARSAEQPLADSLRYGERIDIGSLRFPVGWPEGVRGEGIGIVFEITGASVSTPVRLASGELLPGRDIPRSVRVFACSTFGLDGRIDRRRERALAASYMSVC